MNWQSLFAGVLSILMVLDCVLLVLLVLLQLPKKEAGAGVAFGGAATDALFGAGSGNVLTKITKWLAGGFFGLAILLAIIDKPKGQMSVMSKLAAPSAAATAPATPSTSPSAPSAPVMDLKAPTPATTAPDAAPALAPSTAAKPAAETPAPATSTNK